MKYYRGEEEIDVTKGAYESIFKGMGWKPKKEVEEENVDDNFDIDGSNEEDAAEGADEEDLTYLFDKAPEEFTQEEAKKFVERYEITVETGKDGKSTKAHVIKAIKKFIEEHN